MAFKHYLEEEDDKPYFTTNSLGYYYDKMEGFAEKVEQAAKILNVTKEEVEKNITAYIEQNKNELDQRLAQWDEKLETFDSSVETLLTEWANDGTLTPLIDSTLIEQRIAPLSAQLEKTSNEVKRKRELEDLAPSVIAAIEGGEGAEFNLLSIPQDESVTLKKTNFYKESTNKYDSSKIVPNTFINATTGLEVVGDTFDASPFIPVKPGQSIFIRKARHIAFYNSDNIRISGENRVSGERENILITSPDDVGSIRFSWGKSDLTNIPQQMNIGQEMPYEDYYLYLGKENLERHDFDAEEIPDNSLTHKKASFIEEGKNLFNKDDVIPNTYINENDGRVLPNSSMTTSKKMDIKAGLAYSFTSLSDLRVVYWGEFGNFVSGIYPVTNPVIPPLGAIQIQYSFRTSNLSIMQFEQNAVSTSYQKYGIKIPLLLTESSSMPDVENNDYPFDVYGKHFLKNFLSQASKYRRTDFNERLEIGIIGDSWVRTGKRIAEPLRDILKEKYGDAGIGYTGFSEIRMGNGETITSITGTWQGTVGVHSLNCQPFTSSEVGATLQLKTYEPSDILEIHHLTQIGSYRYRINGGTWTTVNTNQATPVIRNDFGKVNITLDIEVLSGTVTLLNAYLFNGNRGAVVHKMGSGGAMASRFTGINRQHFISELQKTKIQAFGILLGTNDMAQNVPIDTFKTNIKELINRIKTAKPLADVFLIAPSGNNLTGRLHNMKEYSDALLEVATEDKVGFVSLYDNMGTYAEQNERGLFEDDVHPNEDGGFIIGNIVHDRLLRV